MHDIKCIVLVDHEMQSNLIIRYLQGIDPIVCYNRGVCYNRTIFFAVLCNFVENGCSYVITSLTVLGFWYQVKAVDTLFECCGCLDWFLFSLSKYFSYQELFI